MLKTTDIKNISASSFDRSPYPLSPPKPFLKWAGGKTQLLSQIKNYIPTFEGRYYEPFIGGGALFFYLQFNLKLKYAYISDINPDLVTTYKVIRDNVKELIEDLKYHSYDEEYFYKIRSIDRTISYESLSDIQKASRLIYLNKTCYNGLYRVNSKGQFNVPFGRHKRPNICDELNLIACSHALQETEIKNVSFEAIASLVKAGDFVYFDPPYIPLSNSSSFIEYNSKKFNIGMQEKLRDLCIELDKKGVKFLASNSSADLVLELYKPHFQVEFVRAGRAINSKGDRRGKIDEVLIRNY
ncbi:MAG: DNA adenine methylase [Cyanobacteriota bacterium]|nr:DNA adenine methylase [Cyanobacteriota bacterium]